MTTGPGSREARGLVPCPWGCGAAVRRTVNNNAKRIYISPHPDPAGRIAAWDNGAQWRSRQLHKGETVLDYEDLYVIHNATCWVLLRRNGRPGRPPAAVSPASEPRGPDPAEMARLRERLDAVRTGRGRLL